MSSISKNVLAPIEAISGDGKNRVRVEFLRLTLPSKWFLALLAIPMLIALAISGYLTYVSLTAAKILGCTGGELFDCSHVIYSKWSKVVGIPVSALALGTYVAMILAACVVSMKKLSSAVRLTAWSVVTGLAIAAALAGLYFIYLQVFVLEHLCPWCLGAHTCGLLIAATILLSRSRIAMPPLAGVSGLAAAGLALMIGIQINSEEPKKYEELVYTPPAKVDSSAVQRGGTFTAAPTDFDAPEDEGMMMPPGDDDMFAPPIEDDSFMVPPSEDDEESIGSFQFNGLRNFELAVLSQMLMTHGSLPMVAVLQEPVIQEQAGSGQKMPTGSGQKMTTGSGQKAAAGSGQKMTQQEKMAAQKKQMAARQNAQKKKANVRIVQFMGKKLNAYQWPIDGKPTAKYVFVEMFDYTCPHCRTTSKAVFAAKENMGDDLAVIVLPVPMNTACNPSVQIDHPSHVEACQLSELAVAVWRTDPDKFSEFHKWMFEGQIAPIYTTALGKASELVGKEKIEKELKKGTSRAYVKGHCQMYKALNAGLVPKLLFPTRAIQGEFTAVEALTSMIKEQAAVPQQAVAK